MAARASPCCNCERRARRFVMRCFKFFAVLALVASACSTADNAGRQSVAGGGGSIGTVGDDGVFHGNGYVGGVVIVTATIGGSATSSKITVDVDIVDNPANLPTTDQGTLVAGGAGDATFKWLYPYDQTVFPRGLQAPVLQFAGTAADAMYVQVTAPH